MKKHIPAHNSTFSPALLVYNIGLYIFLTAALPYFLIKIATTKKYRAGIFYRLGFLPAHKRTLLGKGRHIWFHAVSVGEVNAAIPLLEKLKTEFPDNKILLSTTTLTGQEIAQKWAGNDPGITVIYFPLDFYHIFSALFSHCTVELIVIMETEIWPNFLLAAHRYKIPVILVNGRISEKSFNGYNKVRKLFLKSVRPITTFCMQTEEDAEKLRQLGIDKSRIFRTGNLKFEASLTVPINKEIGLSIINALSWKDSEPIWVVGSTHRGEEELICDIYLELKKRFTNLKMIIAPRHPERIGEVSLIMQNLNIPFVKKTEIDSKQYSAAPCFDVVLLDTMGELRHIYSIATIVFIGKSLVPGGGQNILEPASLGKPVLFGQYMDNFADITRRFLASDAGIMAKDQTELKYHLLSLLDNDELRVKLGASALKIVQQHQGATTSILSHIKKSIQ
ncbi:3-deoxy-D-manno-octulosonic acid transferase [bacterium]|nr:3-deoxy-D-manno-octulosonic acid transferase [bacterium]MCP5461748.1 3-deoxy-D-manno-octulosonic acid transferase [bacterium]